jgi:methyl-accepting chemotaxis protein
LRNQLIDVALAAGALSILGGAALGIFLARPIRRLNEVVERIRQGDQDARADESGEDEVSFLAESFNELMDEIRERGRR